MTTFVHDQEYIQAVGDVADRAAWANDTERKRIQSLETAEHWSDPEQRKLPITAMLAAQTRFIHSQP
jgi:hypothetical protein